MGKMKVLNMENDKVESVVEHEEFSVIDKKEKPSLNEVKPNLILTNNQKLELLIKLIQDTDENLKTGGITKKIIK